MTTGRWPWDGNCSGTKGTIKIRTAKGPGGLDEDLAKEKLPRD